MNTLRKGAIGLGVVVGAIGLYSLGYICAQEKKIERLYSAAYSQAVTQHADANQDNFVTIDEKNLRYASIMEKHDLQVVEKLYRNGVGRTFKRIDVQRPDGSTLSTKEITDILNQHI